MIGGKTKETLTKEAILSRISEYDIFRRYIPHKFELNKATYSVFRNETNPSMVVGSKRGTGGLYFIDFADTSKKGNCFEFVKLLFNLPTFHEVLKMIDKDFCLGISDGRAGEYSRIISSYEQPVIEKKYSVIQVVVRKFTKEELAYWNQYHQSEQDLKDNNIYSVEKIYFNKMRFALKDTELRFGYLYGDRWKIYRPFSDRKVKWMPNNVPITEMDGKKDIEHCRIAIITKSKKDYMVMKKVYPHCCAVQNEGVSCFSKENVLYLKDNSDVQILSFDSDEVGVKNSQQITKLFDFQYLNVPKAHLSEGIKDWADFAKTYGLPAIEDYLKQKQLL